MKIDENKAYAGHYTGMTDWLENNFGPPGKRWRFIYYDYPDLPDRLYSVEFTSKEDELLFVLRWGC